MDFHFDCGGGFDPCYVMSLRSRRHGRWRPLPPTFIVTTRNRTGIGRNSGGLHDHFRFHHDLMRGVLTGLLCDGGKGNVRGNPRVEMASTSSGSGYRRRFLFNGFGGGLW